MEKKEEVIEVSDEEFFNDRDKLGLIVGMVWDLLDTFENDHDLRAAQAVLYATKYLMEQAVEIIDKYGW